MKMVVETIQESQMILENMAGHYKPWKTNFSNFSVFNLFHHLDGAGFERNFVHLVYSTLDLIAFHLLLDGPDGLP
jgi:hypothetical protein